MNQNAIIPCIVSLNKIITQTIDNYFTNYEVLKKERLFSEYENLQIKIHTLKEQLNEGFSWYCGSTITKEEKKIEEDFESIENSNPFKKQYDLLNLALEKNQKIYAEIIANYDYKKIFIELEEALNAQLKIVSEIISKSVLNANKAIKSQYVNRELIING